MAQDIPAGFQVAYEVKESPYGQGIFSKQFIPKGTLIWKYKRGTNVTSYRTVDEVRARLGQMSKEEQDYFMSHVYLYDGYMNEILDDGKMWNHSETPNTGQSIDDVQSTYAIRDIQDGEELLDDYGVYEYPDWFVELAKEHSVSQEFLIKKDSRKPGFHVEYELKVGQYGTGVFAKQRIPANTLIWKFSPGVNVKTFDDEQSVRLHLASLPSEEERYFFISHVYNFGGKTNEILDDAKMWNHSGNPNTYSGYLDDWDSTYAKVDIEEGEELLDDYGAYEYPAWFIQLCAEYNLQQDFIENLAEKIF